MTEQEQLLAGVIANPDDDAPRLIYADWLEENGELERSEYIRSMVNNPTTKHSGLFAGDYYPWKGVYIKHRGFIDEVRCTTADYMQHCHAIAAKHPVRKWVLTDCNPCFTNSNYQWWKQQIGSELRQVNGYLPSIFFEGILVGSTVTPHKYRNSVLVYRTEAEAIADLEQACYHYARSKLPYLMGPTRTASTPA